MEDKTLAMELLTDLKATNKRQFIVNITMAVLWFSSIVCIVGIFVWYINQFDYYTEKTTLDGNGVNNYIKLQKHLNGKNQYKLRMHFFLAIKIHLDPKQKMDHFYLK